MNSTIAPQLAPNTAADTTLMLLAERMRQRGDMPGFTRAIGAILCAMRGEDDVQFNLTRSVLSDPILTNKVLRLANSGMYAAFGQRISTVSRAVMVLGIDAVGHLALGLKLIEEVARPGAGALSAQVEMEKAVLAGMVARQVADQAVQRDSEQATVCAMLHSLGRMLVTFYLPERWSAMQAHASEGQEEHAAQAILGLSLTDVGRATAKRWGLPVLLLDSIRESGPRADGSAVPEADWLATVSTLASGCAAALWRDDAVGRGTLETLAANFAPALGVSTEQILTGVDNARRNAAMALATAPHISAQALSPRHGQSQSHADDSRAATSAHLVGGVTDLYESAAGARPEHMISMALETIYNALNFTRVLAFLRHPGEARFAASMGLGKGIDQLLPALQFSDVYQPDVFHAALTSDRVIFIRDAREPQFARRLPAWWTATLGDASSFVLLPLRRKGQPVGLLYGDWVPELAPPQLDQQQFAALSQLQTMMVEPSVLLAMRALVKV